MKMLKKEIGNPLDFLTTPTTPPPPLKGIRQLLWFYNPGGGFCQISGLKVYRGCGSLRIHKTNLLKIATRNESTKRIFSTP